VRESLLSYTNYPKKTKKINTKLVASAQLVGEFCSKNTTTQINLSPLFFKKNNTFK
jgi:hypothetical protein